MDIIEIDAASNNGVDDIRDMREKVKYRPVEGQYKVYIIDEVHMLSGAAFNAFLKTLEEPPPRVIFVLATTDPQKVPATILSRCQCFDFHSIPNKILIERLHDVVTSERESDPDKFPLVPPEALHLIADCVDGGFRDALSLLDQITSAHTGGTISIDDVLEITRRVGYPTLKKLADFLFQRDCSGVILLLNDLFFRGHDVSTLGKDLLEYLRRALVLKIDSKANLVLHLPPEQAKELLDQARNLPLEYLLATVSKLERTLASLRQSVQPRILFEVELLRIAQREVSLGTEGLERRVHQVEEALKSPRVSGKSYSAPQPASSAQVREAPPTSYNPVSRPPVAVEKLSPGELFLQLKKALEHQPPVLKSLFASARLESVKENLITLVFETDFHARQASGPQHADILKKIVEKTFGPQFKLQIRSGNPLEAPQAGPSPEKTNLQDSIAQLDQNERKKFLEKPAIADAIKVFGGDIIGIEKK